MPQSRKPLVVVTAVVLLVVSSSCKKTPKPVLETEGGASSQGGGGGGVPPGYQLIDPQQGRMDESIQRFLDGSLKLHNDATQYDVTYSPQTVLLNEDAVKKSLQKVSSDGTTFTFDAGSADAQKLHAGSVMLLTGVALRKVTGVSQTQGSLVVTTDPAAITEAITDGKIKAKTHVDFGTFQAAVLNAPHSGWTLVPAVYAQGGGTVSPSTPGALKFSMNMDPFTYSVAFTKGPGQINIEMKVSDNTSKLEFVAKGSIQNYDQLLNVAISNGTVTALDFSNSGLTSDLTVNWTAASVVAGPMSKILSWSKMVQKYAGLKDLAITYPFLVGPIPFTIKFTSGIVFVPAFTSKNTAFTGSFTFHYSGDAGFTASNGGSQPTGTITPPDPPQNPITQIISLGPIGFTTSVEFPRIELGMGLGFVTFSPAAYVSPVTSFGLVYGGPAAMLPCETHILAISVKTGISTTSTVWSFLGAATKLNVDAEVFKKQYTGPKPGLMLCPS